MSIKKVTLASLILLSLTACSSGGGSGSSSNNTETKAQPSVQQPNTQNNSDDAKKAEEDRLAKEKAEAERLKKEEADRLAKEKAEAERLKKEEADRLAKEKAEAERLKKEEADRLAKEKAEAERLKKEESDRLAKEKAEAERLKKEEADRLAKEKVESDKYQARIKQIYEQFIAAGADEHYAKAYAEKYANVDEKIVANDLAQFKQDTFEQKLRDANVPELDIKELWEDRFSEDYRIRFLYAVQRMQKLGIDYDHKTAHYHSDNSWETIYGTSLERLLRSKRAVVLGVDWENARQFADSYSSYSEKETKEEIDNKLVNFLKGNEASQYHLGLTQTADKLIYNQKYSITTMPKNDDYIYPNQIITKGLETANRLIPNEGKATYIGKAYGAFNQNGELSYSVDFGKRVGEGKITGVERFKDNIILEKGTIQDNRIVSSTRTGNQAVDANKNSEFNRYEIKFFGPKVEEIGGKATVGDYNFGLVGTRGEITK